ncbi:hypothetical protein L1987_68974 [Smallanthus sonchifolius]|uniref:Uncharacterized protein n=1 Tax=Smallanthus sonchifolius TaxID=185202 RepID=A0ACB9B4E8_9ASTR|nr:hypothetical protein L1987_68974 [Smallanthus sonchifolius]
MRITTCMSVLILLFEACEGCKVGGLGLRCCPWGVGKRVGTQHTNCTHLMRVMRDIITASRVGIFGVLEACSLFFGWHHLCMGGRICMVHVLWEDGVRVGTRSTYLLSEGDCFTGWGVIFLGECRVVLLKESWEGRHRSRCRIRVRSGTCSFVPLGGLVAMVTYSVLAPFACMNREECRLKPGWVSKDGVGTQCTHITPFMNVLSVGILELGSYSHITLEIMRGVTLEDVIMAKGSNRKSKIGTHRIILFYDKEDSRCAWWMQRKKLRHAKRDDDVKYEIDVSPNATKV